ncbi:hypothetical protein [Sphingobacterium suaedae]|uniref:Thiamine pyrophosphokinase n=1 Tax=Sphingobacterium suaedae TaxID=1686402 RepID=A0ABW5KC57_9SPHI
MSSHHIVRENQEPALILGSIQDLPADYIGQLLEWSPTVLASAYTVDFLLAEGIKVDIVCTNDAAIYAQEEIQILSSPQDFVLACVTHLIAKDYGAVNIVNSYIPKELSTLADRINVVLFCAGIRYVFVREHYEKWVVAGTRIVVAEHTLKSFVNLRKISVDTFETEDDGFFYVDLNTGDFVAIGEKI